MAAATTPVPEGSAAEFLLERTGDTAAELTVAVAVTEAGAVLSGTPATAVTFAAGSAEARLSVATQDDTAAEADARVTAQVSAGTGYRVAAEAATAAVDVYDNDAAATAAQTLWTSELTVRDFDVVLGHVGSGNLAPDRWTEQGVQYRVTYLYYFPEHSELAFQVTAAPPEPGELTLHLDELQVELSGATGQRGFYFTVADPGWQDGQTVAVKLTRTDPDGALASGPGLSVADAAVLEAEGAQLAFEVTLAQAQSTAVSVRYATSDGTATAGTDYVAGSGAVRFEAGETAQTIAVAVLNDAHDEGSETLTLELTQPYGAQVTDGAATGTISNSDELPRAWLARFGRTAAEHVLDAVQARLRGATGTPAALAGHVLDRTASVAAGGGAALFEDAWAEPQARELSIAELVSGSAFAVSQISAGALAEEGDPRWTVWGHGAWSRFTGSADEVSVDGEVVTGTFGADWEQDRWLLGLALAYSVGSGSYEDGDGRSGDLESWLASVHPYLRVAP